MSKDKHPFLKRAFLSNFELLPKKPTAEETEEISTADGMRKRIESFSKHDPLTRRIYDMSHYKGASDYDRMTALAFHALAKAQRLERQLLDIASHTQRPYRIFTDEHLKIIKD